MGLEQTGGKGSPSPIGDPRLQTDIRHSYEAFTERPFYRDVNRQTVQLAPISRVVLDMATGTGGIIELLHEESKLLPVATVVGVDIDESALSTARGKFTEKFMKTASTDNQTFPHIIFNSESSEHTGEKSAFFDLVTICNAIHLTDVSGTMEEAYRVLQPAGTFLANSAFVDGIGYPTSDAAQLWSNLGRGAIKKAMKMGHRPTESPKNYFKFNREEYEGKAREAGFKDVEISEIQTLMDIDDVLAICHYDEFATGALPGVPLDIAHQVLTESAIEVFNKLKATEQPQVFPRGWMVMRAVKPMALAA